MYFAHGCVNVAPAAEIASRKAPRAKDSSGYGMAMTFPRGPSAIPGARERRREQWKYTPAVRTIGS